jgi:hypothetical protein
VRNQDERPLAVGEPATTLRSSSGGWLEFVFGLRFERLSGIDQNARR